MSAATGSPEGLSGSVAVVGLGQMGAGIARNLHSAGLLGGAFDLRQEALAASGLPSSVPFEPVATLLGHCSVLLFAVQTTEQVRDILLANEIPAGRLVVDVTTSAPTESRNLSVELSSRGVAFVDAAMTGGAAGADAGRLTLMVGGAPEDVARCAPVFDAIAAQTFHLGPVGAGHTMKLVHNMILHSSFLATCEGLTVAARAGLDVGDAVAVLNAGNARSFVTDTRFPRDILSGTMQTRSTISNLAKDLSLAHEMSGGLAASAPFARLARDLLSAAAEGEGGGRDFAWLFPDYEAHVAAAEVTP